MNNSFSRRLLKIYSLGHSMNDPDFEWWSWYCKQPIIFLWHRWIGYQVLKFAGQPKSVLSLGCGSSPVLGEFKGRVVGVDLVGEKLDFIRSKFPKIETICADITKMESIGKFDCVVCSEVLEHLHPEDLPKAIKLAAESAENRVIVSSPNYEVMIGRLVENFIHKDYHYDIRLASLDSLLGDYGFTRVRTRRLFWDTVSEYRR